jgi:hypothetical protein
MQGLKMIDCHSDRPDPSTGVPPKQNSTSKCSRTSLRRGLCTLLLLLIAWSPAWITGSLMHRYAVDIPVWDDFERAELLDRYQSGTLDWKFLTSAHIEHRILLPRLIILANARFADGSLRNEVAVNFSAMFIGALCWACLVRKTRPGRMSNWLLIFLINLCIFSLLQYQNLCWAIQTAFFLPLTFLALMLTALHSSLRGPVRFLLAALCALGATMCFAHGLMLWPVAAVWFLAAGNSWSWKKRILVAGSWTLIALVVWVLYFKGISSTSHPSHSYMQQPGDYPPGFSDLVGGKLRVLKVIQAWLLGLGSHYCRVVLVNPKTIAPWTGGLILLLFSSLGLTSLVRCIRSRSALEWNRLLPWLLLGGYAAGAALLVSLGRSNFGTTRAMSPRYLTISLYLSVALIALSAMVVPPLFKTCKGAVRIRSLGFLLAGMLIAVQCWNWLYGLRGLQLWNAARWQSLSEHVFREFAHSEHPARLDYSSDYALEQIDRLTALGYLNFPAPVSAGNFNRFTVAPHAVDEKHGGLISVRAVEQPAPGWRIEGFSNLRGRIRRVPDAVVFTTGAENERVIVGYAEPVHGADTYFIPLDFEFSDLNLPDQESRNRWSGCLRAEHLPAADRESISVTIWAVDFKNNTVYPHPNPVVLYPADAGRSNYERPWKRRAAGQTFEDI